MNCKAVITDLDRTLLRTDKTLSEYTAKVLRRVKEKDIKIIAATARPKRSVIEYNDTVGFDALVCLNGAEIICGDTQEERCIPHNVAEKLLKDVCATGEYVISAEISGVLYANAVFPQWESVLYKDFPLLPKGSIHKLIFSYSDEALHVIRNALTDSLYCTVANKQLIQIMNKKATKLNGISKVLNTFKISPEEAIFFGDDNDDLEAIKTCGIGVAVQNAIPEVKAAADVVIGANDNDSVAEFLLNFFFNDMNSQ